jgi:hypothetical protein
MYADKRTSSIPFSAFKRLINDCIPPRPKGKPAQLELIATRQDIPNHTQRYGFRLISGFISFLEELAQKQIFIRNLYAVSAETEGKKLCKGIGFLELPKEEGDLFPRFGLSLETSESHFAQRYREAVEKAQTSATKTTED